MAKKLDLTKMRAGQTVYVLDSNIRKRNDWWCYPRPLTVNNAPTPKFEGADYYYGEAVSRHSLKMFVDDGYFHRRGEGYQFGTKTIFATRNAAQRECDRINLRLNRIRKLAAEEIQRKTEEQTRRVLYTGSI